MPSFSVALSTRGRASAASPVCRDGLTGDPCGGAARVHEAHGPPRRQLIALRLGRRCRPDDVVALAPAQSGETGQAEQSEQTPVIEPFFIVLVDRVVDRFDIVRVLRSGGVWSQTPRTPAQRLTRLRSSWW